MLADVSEELAFRIKDGLVDALRAAVEAAGEGDPLHGVDVHESWPVRAVQGKRSVLVLDFEGDERPASMRAGGGTRDDTFRIDVAAAVWEFESDARVLRGLARPISNAIKAMVRAEGAANPGGIFGVANVRQPEIRAYKVREYVLEEGKRECDVHLSIQFTARHRAAE